MSAEEAFFSISRPISKKDFLRYYEDTTHLAQLLTAPFGLSTSAIDVLGKEATNVEYNIIYRQWEDLLSRRVYSAKGVSDDRVAASMHKFLEINKDDEVVKSIQAAGDAISNIVEVPPVVELPTPSHAAIAHALSHMEVDRKTEKDREEVHDEQPTGVGVAVDTLNTAATAAQLLDQVIGALKTAFPSSPAATATAALSSEQSEKATAAVVSVQQQSSSCVAKTSISDLTVGADVDTIVSTRFGIDIPTRVFSPVVLQGATAAAGANTLVSQDRYLSDESLQSLSRALTVTVADGSKGVGEQQTVAYTLLQYYALLDLYVNSKEVHEVLIKHGLSTGDDESKYNQSVPDVDGDDDKITTSVFHENAVGVERLRYGALGLNPSVYPTVAYVLQLRELLAKNKTTAAVDGVSANDEVVQGQESSDVNNEDLSSKAACGLESATCVLRASRDAAEAAGVGNLDSAVETLTNALEQGLSIVTKQKKSSKKKKKDRSNKKTKKGGGNKDKKHKKKRDGGEDGSDGEDESGEDGSEGDWEDCDDDGDDDQEDEEEDGSEGEADDEDDEEEDEGDEEKEDGSEGETELEEIRVQGEHFLPTFLKVQLLVERAKYLTEQGALPAAHRDCTAAINLDPRCVPAYALRAQLWGGHLEGAGEEGGVGYGNSSGGGVGGVSSESGVLMAAAKDALSAFLIGGSTDLSMAASAEEAAREACRNEAKAIFHDRVRTAALRDDGNKTDQLVPAESTFPRAWLVRSFLAGYDCLSTAFGLDPVNMVDETVVDLTDDPDQEQGQTPTWLLQTEDTATGDVRKDDDKDAMGDIDEGVHSHSHPAGSTGPLRIPPTDLLDVVESVTANATAAAGIESAPRELLRDNDREAYWLLRKLVLLLESTQELNSSEEAHLQQHVNDQRPAYLWGTLPGQQEDQHANSDDEGDEGEEEEEEAIRRERQNRSTLTELGMHTHTEASNTTMAAKLGLNDARQLEARARTRKLSHLVNHVSNKTAISVPVEEVATAVDLLRDIDLPEPFETSSSSSSSGDDGQSTVVLVGQGVCAVGPPVKLHPTEDTTAADEAAAAAALQKLSIEKEAPPPATAPPSSAYKRCLALLCAPRASELTGVRFSPTGEVVWMEEVSSPSVGETARLADRKREKDKEEEQRKKDGSQGGKEEEDGDWEDCDDDDGSEGDDGEKEDGSQGEDADKEEDETSSGTPPPPPPPPQPDTTATATAATTTAATASDGNVSTDSSPPPPPPSSPPPLSSLSISDGTSNSSNTSSKIPTESPSEVLLPTPTSVADRHSFSSSSSPVKNNKPTATTTNSTTTAAPAATPAEENEVAVEVILEEDQEHLPGQQQVEDSSEGENGVDTNTGTRRRKVSRSLRARLLSVCSSLAYLSGDAVGSVRCLRASIDEDNIATGGALTDSSVKLGSLLVDMDDLDEAGTILTSLSKAHPDDPVLLLHCAELQINRNEFAASVVLLRKALRAINNDPSYSVSVTSPSSPAATAATATATVSSKDTNNTNTTSGNNSYGGGSSCSSIISGKDVSIRVRAIRDRRERLLTIMKRQLGASVYALLGVAMFRNAPMHPEVALSVLEQGIAKYPESLYLLLCAGEVTSQAGDIVKALKYFALASKMDPLHPLPFVNAARTYTQLSQPKNAAKHLARAISVDPALATTRVDLAQSFLLQGQAQLALDTLHVALQLARHVSEIRDVLTALTVAKTQLQLQEEGLYSPPAHTTAAP